MWPELVLINGRPRHPQSQGSVEKANGSMKDSLMAWMKEHAQDQEGTPKWSYGLMFVQWSLNTTVHEGD